MKEVVYRGRNEGEGLGIAGFVFGIISIFLGPIGFIPGIVGLILSSMQLNKKKTGLAIAGVVLSVIGILISVLFFLMIILIWRPVWDTLEKGLEERKECIGLEFSVIDINEEADIITIKKDSGNGDVSKIKIFVNGLTFTDIDANDLAVGDSIEVKVDDLRKSDRVSVAPVLTNGVVCQRSVEKVV